MYEDYNAHEMPCQAAHPNVYRIHITLLGSAYGCGNPAGGGQLNVANPHGMSVPPLAVSGFKVDGTSAYSCTLASLRSPPPSAVQYYKGEL